MPHAAVRSAGTPEDPLPPFEEEKPPSGPVKVPIASSWPKNDLPVNGWDWVAAGALGVGVVVVQFGVPNQSVGAGGARSVQ